MKFLASLILPIFLIACSSSDESKHQAAIASAHPLATQAGMDVLNQGGNAFDAAIAVASVLAVVEPYSAGMGGGGFWLLHDAKQNKNVFVDAREKAPLKAHRDMYLDINGNVIPKLSVNGPMAAGIPGQAAAFAHLAENYGKLPLNQSLKASIQIAKDGFPVDAYYRKLAGFRKKALRQYSHAASIFLDEGKVPELGYVVKQPDLSNTLQLLADKGFDGFYKGEVAKRLVMQVQRKGGIWQMGDLRNYNIVEREPVLTYYGPKEQQFKIISAPPPSSGGLAIAQMMNMLTQLKADKEIHWETLAEADQIHLLSEVMRRAYRDRAMYLGDPDFVTIPTNKLLDMDYAKNFIQSIDMNKATKSSDIGEPVTVNSGFHTTHLSVLDGFGNRVSATLSINLPFGSAYVAEGTGVLLNNEMDDFSSKPGVPNAYGLVGNEANAIAPEKRPLSSMTPSFVENGTENNGGVAILGTPGGSRIITMVFLGMLEHIQNKPVEAWVDKKRFHHQYLPDVIQHEPDTFSKEVKKVLQEKGHELKDVGRKYGNMHAIHLDKNTNKVTAASDKRGVGQSLVQ